MRRNYNGFLFYKHTDKEVFVYFPTRRSALRGVSPDLVGTCLVNGFSPMSSGRGSSR
jgi:hypothetical protein